MADEELNTSETNEDLWFEDDDYSGLKNVALVLIDISESMFDETRSIKKCLVAVYQQMDKMLLRGYRRNISVCFMRDENIIFTGFNDNIVESSKKIMGLLQKSTEELQKQLQRTTLLSLKYTFSECLKQLQSTKVSPYIILMTNDDDPHRGDVGENLSAIDVALSFKESNVKLIVLPLREDFKYEIFYGELLKATNEVVSDIIDIVEDRAYISVEELNDILECIIKNKVFIRRFFFKIFNKEGHELAIWTQLRQLMRPNNLYPNCSLSRVTNNTVKMEYKSSINISVDKFVVRVREQAPIFVKKSSFPLMKAQMSIGLRLLYLTKDKRTSVHFLKNNGLILQNDETIGESEFPKKQKLFDDLWHYCRKNHKYMVCAYQGVGPRQLPHFIEFTPDVFQKKPCFVGQIFVDVEEVGDQPSDDESGDETCCSKYKHRIPQNDRELQHVLEMIDKLTVKNFSPAKIQSRAYESKAALVKAHMLDIEVPNVGEFFPTMKEVQEKLGSTYSKLADIFAIVEEPKVKRQKRTNK